jgi:hypothetical protein
MPGEVTTSKRLLESVSTTAERGRIPGQQRALEALAL